jgi:4-hydroxybenzoate polyprenyltransferase
MSGALLTPGPATPVPSAPSPRWLPYAQLLRLPNVFTAMADIALAALVTGSLPDQLISFLLLVLASSCIYCAGMVWNDYFDYEVDLKERPFRPLPSNRIDRPTAARLGWGLVAAGMVLAALAGVRGDGYHFGSPLIALLLTGAIFLYDGWLKHTIVGPVSMGLCRFLNVLLGLTVAVDGVPAWGFVLALVVGGYIVGVTWFARLEARVSRRLELVAAALVMGTALALSLFLPVLGWQLNRSDVATGPMTFVFGELGHVLFPYLLVAYGFYVGLPVAAAIRNPSPGQVQAAVKRAVLGLTVLDAVLATSLAGTPGLLILLLLPVSLRLGKRIYST